MNGEKKYNKIIEEIERRGPVTFFEFMNMALYHPEEGYYMKDSEKIGPGGDFYTSSDVSSLFGMAIADQMVEMWSMAGSPPEWTVLEFGPGKGSLARDILNHTALSHRDFQNCLQYMIIEKSPSMRLRQERTLSGAGSPGKGLEWLGGPGEIPPGSIAGCVFSNELLDAFPVHRVIKEEDELKEIYVTFKNSRLVEQKGTPSTWELAEYISDFGIILEEGQSIEINLAMKDWLKSIGRIISKGFILTIDYGDTAKKLYSLNRPDGTIRSYSKHRIGGNLYDRPGDQDITASVNFSALFKWGEEEGLLEAGYTSQARFLMNMGIMDYFNSPAPGQKFDPVYAKNIMAVKQLLMPEGMGAVFKVAAQYRGFDSRPALQGYSGKFGVRA